MANDLDDTARGILASAPPSDSLPLPSQGVALPAHERRLWSAYLLALHGGTLPARGKSHAQTLGPSAAAAAAWLGVSADTISGDWRRDDVRALAARATVAGFAAVMLAAVRSGMLLQARAAAAGDAAALLLLVDLLDRVGGASGVLSFDASSPDVQAEALADGVALFADDSAAAALAAIVSEHRGTPGGGAGGREIL